MSKVAIIGAGVAGIGAAHRLQKAGFEVYLFDVQPRIGGDCFGVDVRLQDGSIYPIDAGVSDFNLSTFVEVKKLLDEMNMHYYPIVQDAAYMTPEGRTVWCYKRGELHCFDGVTDASRLRTEMERFCRDSIEVIDNPAFAGWTVRQYIDHRGYSEEFWKLYLEPRAMGCFPMPNDAPSNYLVSSLVSFWRVHGVVGGTGTPQRMVVEGGMHQYCKHFERWFLERGGHLYCSTNVVGVARRRRCIEVRAVTRDDEHLTFRVDHVVLATNSSDVLPLLEDATPAEQAHFSEFPCQRALLCIHQDPRLMPDEPAAWGAYNYVVPRGQEPEVRPTITFFPNRLANLGSEVPDVFVTMNPHRDPNPELVLCNRFFVHPVATGRTREVAAKIQDIQGTDNTWYCGSYLIEPFVHEQALVTGIDAAEKLIAAA